MNSTEMFWMIIKIAVVVLILLQVVPLMIWVERRGSALMQNRLGPNRVGPLGIFQSLADALKFMFKEDIIPDHVEKFYYVIAPGIMLIPAFMTFAVIPFASPAVFDGTTIKMQIADLNVGFLYIFSIASLGVYGLIVASWASNNKYSLLGGLRSTSQMISYEVSMGLSVIGIVMLCGSVNLNDIVNYQKETLFGFLPRWGVFTQPLAFIIFLTTAFAETNRLPFDLPEGESEIVAGYHTEYGSMKMALFFMAEYINMFVASALISTFFFGGYLMLPGMDLLIGPLSNLLSNLFSPQDPQQAARIILEVTSLMIKIGFFMWFFVWVRWTLPRFRFDQLMQLGWKVLLPLSLVNLLVTAVLIYMGVF
jgi:NADH-quinone oxidoreductase subunit H